MSKVTVFSTKSCPWCIQAKEYLKENAISFENVDVNEDEEMFKKMYEKSKHTGVPQIWIDDEVIVGFDVNRLNELLKIDD